MTMPANQEQAAVAVRRTPGHRGAWLLFSLGIGIAVCGMTLDLKLRPRALPRNDAPLLAKPVVSARPPEALATLVKMVAPALGADLRARLVDAVILESTRGGYDPLFLLAIVGVESSWRVAAESNKGARGLLQLQPGTFAWISAREPDVGGEHHELGDDPVVDVRLGIRYLSWLESQFKSRDAALMAYNAGPHRARQLIREGDVPDSLRAYPQRVRQEYERLLGLERAGRDLSGALAQE